MLISYLAIIDTPQEKAEFVKLYEKYRKLMHYAAGQILGDNHLAEEAVQEAFLRIAKNFSKVYMADSHSVKKFVLIITENAARTLYRNEMKHNAGREHNNDTEKTAEDYPAGKDTTASGAEMKEVVRYILQMPDLQQDVLFLHAVYGFSYRETAGLLGISESAARKRGERAGKELAEWMRR